MKDPSGKIQWINDIHPVPTFNKSKPRKNIDQYVRRKHQVFYRTARDRVERKKP